MTTAIAGLLARLSFPPTRLLTKEGHPFQCRGVLVRICRPQDVFLHRISGKSKACHQSHIISLVICTEQKFSILICNSHNIFPAVSSPKNAHYTNPEETIKEGTEVNIIHYVYSRWMLSRQLVVYRTDCESRISNSALHLSLKMQEIKKVFSKDLKMHYVYIR